MRTLAVPFYNTLSSGVDMEDYSAFVADAASPVVTAAAAHATARTVDSCSEPEYEASWEIRQRAKEQLDTDNRALYDLIYKYALFSPTACARTCVSVSTYKYKTFTGLENIYHELALHKQHFVLVDGQYTR